MIARFNEMMVLNYAITMKFGLVNDKTNETRNEKGVQYSSKIQTINIAKITLKIVLKLTLLIMMGKIFKFC